MMINTHNVCLCHREYHVLKNGCSLDRWRLVYNDIAVGSYTRKSARRDQLRMTIDSSTSATQVGLLKKMFIAFEPTLISTC
jgi:hypothetical protein